MTQAAQHIQAITGNANTEMLDQEPTPGGLVKFHTAHKLTLMAHSPKHYTGMGGLFPNPVRNLGKS